MRENQMNPLVTALGEHYVMSQRDVAEKTFLSVNTIIRVEKEAIANFKKKLAERGIDIKDLL